MSTASYNITNDKLKVWFDERLSDEEYARAKSLGFTFWHGSKCFVSKWRPDAETFITAKGIEIEEDDTPDDVEGRVDRFAKYADKATAHAESSQEYLDERANTERRKKLAAASVSKQLGAAEHWQSRIQGAIRSAAYKERPDVIARRIKGLGTDLRRQEKVKAGAENSLKLWGSVDMNAKTKTGVPMTAELMKARATAIANYDGISLIGDEKEAYGWSLWSGLNDGKLTPEKAREIAERCHKGIIAHAERWIAHINDRLTYENACLEAAGGLPVTNGPTVEVGGAVKGGWQCRNFCEVFKVAKKSLRVKSEDHWRDSVLIPKESVTEVLTKDEWDERKAKCAAYDEAAKKNTGTV